MSDVPAEATAVHTRIMKCALEVDDARAYWARLDDGPQATRAQRAFDEYWFGARSMSRVRVLVANFRHRFDAFPAALAVLRSWPTMAPPARKLICHWHLQLADPVYRAFTGGYLVARREMLRPDVTRELVVRWVGTLGPARWTLATRTQFASKLLSAAYAAGLVTTNRDPRPLHFPRVDDQALGYLMYLLRGVRFDGTLLDNPYAASVGLGPGFIEDRLRSLPSLRFLRQGDLVDYGWRHPDLASWARATLAAPAEPLEASV